MCGIGGIVLSNKKGSMDKDLEVNTITLLMELQNRGKNAWGIYLKKAKDNHNLYCGVTDSTLKGELFKTKDSVSEFFGDKGNKIYLDGTNLVLMHTRASTQGSPEENENNHPFNTDNFILSHNGCLHNDTYIKKHFKIDSNIECDSYIIIALIQKFFDEGTSVVKSIEEAMKHITGSFACWLYHKDKEELYLFRNSNPIYYLADKKNNAFAFASESKFIKRAYNRKDVTEDSIKELPSYKIFKLTDGELSEVGKIDFTSSTSTALTRGNNSCCSNNIHSASLNLTAINESLVYLYKTFEVYEHNREIETVIAIVRNDIILLVKPKALMSILDEVGFKKFKKTKPVYGSDYYKYTITPKENINELVNALRKEIDGDDDDEGNTPPSNTETNGDIKLYEDLAEVIGCKFTSNDKYIEFELNGDVEYDDRIKGVFTKVGLNFNEDNTIKMVNSEYHRERLKVVMRKMEVDMDD